MPDKEPTKPPPKEPSRDDEAREVVKEYADDQRKIIEKLRRTSISQLDGFWVLACFDPQWPDLISRHASYSFGPFLHE